MELKEEDPRFIVFAEDSGNTLVSWNPDGASAKDKIFYAACGDRLKVTLDVAPGHSHQANDVGDLDALEL